MLFNDIFDWLVENWWLVLIAPVVLIGLIFLTALAALPGNLRTEEIGDEDVPKTLLPAIEAFRALGFERCGPALKVYVNPRAIFVPLIHEKDRSFAATFEIVGHPDKRGNDVVSLLETDQCGLTTSVLVDSGAAPAWPGSLRQIFPDADPAELYRRHIEAQRHLQQLCLACRSLRVEDLVPALVDSFRLQRRVFTSSPVVSTCRALWRTITRRNPHIGPLSAQPIAEQQIRAIRDGLWPKPERTKQLAQS